MEDVAHIFCKCPTTLNILSAPPFNLQDSLLPSINFKEWMLDHAMHLKPETFEKLLMIIWALWKNRNNMLWKQTSQSAQDILLSSLAWLEEFHAARKPVRQPKVMRQKRWKPTSNGRWKLNVDGAFLPQMTKGGAGGVLRDANGQFIAAFAHPVQHISSSKHVELQALKEGLDLLTSMGLQNVTIESDCLEATEEVMSDNYEFSIHAGLIDDIKMAMQRGRGVKLQHEAQTCNIVAHRLANIAFEAEHRTIWYSVAPDIILDVLQSDCNHLV
ncbi:hypothetical protein ABKV19_026762 [Rosa sericea]